MTKLQSVTVYCGSNAGNKPLFKESAIVLAKELAARNYALVYGGASVGIMGAVADTVLENKGKAIGVITEALIDVELAHTQLSEIQVVSTMHERKAIMHDIGDAFVILPGGSGTMDEFFEIHTWAQLGYHQKPIGLLNVDNYYQPIIDFYDNAVKNGFIKKEHADMLIVESDPYVLLNRLENYQPTVVKKWIEEA